MIVMEVLKQVMKAAQEDLVAKKKLKLKGIYVFLHYFSYIKRKYIACGYIYVYFFYNR